MAILRGSVSPSNSTITGAPILQEEREREHDCMSVCVCLQRVNLICSALVPNTLALSYLVIYGVEVLSAKGTG